MAAQLNAQAIADKWAQRMSAAGQAYLAGVQSVTTSPMQLAAAQEAKAAANYAQAISSGRWKNALQSKTLADWQNGCKVGSANFATGATKGKQKLAAALAKLIPIYGQMKAASVAAGGGKAGWSAAYDVMKQAKDQGQTK